MENVLIEVTESPIEVAILIDETADQVGIQITENPADIVNITVENVVENVNVNITETVEQVTVEIKKAQDGNDGYTPVKGVDYFDGQDGKDGSDGQDGYTPVKGVDYFDGEKGDKGDQGDVGNFELEFARKAAGNSYMEPTFTDGKLTQVDYWEDDSKAAKLFTKIIQYTGNNPTLSTLTDETDGRVLTTIISYESGILKSVSKIIT